MTTRTSRKTVTFTRPFNLAGIGPQAAGRYDVDTDEELIDDLSFLAWRRVSTVIHVRKDGALQVHRIDPAELDASLLRDAGLTMLPQAG
jgi:fructose 1,6-bisphosphatase